MLFRSILDSLAVLRPEKFSNTATLGSDMSVTSAAKSFANFFRSIKGMLLQGNIILIVVNHLLDLVKINPYDTSTGPNNYLPAGKTVYGGNTPVYLSNFVINIKPGKKIKSDDSFGIDGFINEVWFSKNRSNKAGKKFPTVFNQELGFMSVLSDYYYLKNISEKITGAGVSFKLTSMPDVKFSQKKFLTVYNKNKEFRKTFNKEVRREYEKFIYIPEVDGPDGSELGEEEIVK